MTNYTVAAEQSREMRSRTIRPAARDSERVPAGTSHAVAPGSDTTACGLAVVGLDLFPETDFVSASLLARCRECQQVVTPA